MAVLPQGLTPLLLAITMLLQLTRMHVTATRPVDVDYYMESQCPYCVNLTLYVLKPLFHQGFSPVINLRVIPYGNAHIDKDTGRIVCQHGEMECAFNELLNCALDEYRNQDQFFPFLYCVEKDDRDPDVSVLALGEKCAEEADLDWRRLHQCYSSGQGEKLHQQAGVTTNALRPAHKYVPWMVVNGIPLLEDDENLMRYICAAYTGKRPEACFEVDEPLDAKRDSLRDWADVEIPGEGESMSVLEAPKVLAQAKMLRGAQVERR